MPGESPGRDWDALLNPPSIWDVRRAEQAHKAMRRRQRIWSAFVIIVIAAVFLGWLSLLPWVLHVPEPWNWVTIFGWALVLLPGLIFIAVVILRWLERRVLPATDRELAAES